MRFQFTKLGNLEVGVHLRKGKKGLLGCILCFAVGGCREF